MFAEWTSELAYLIGLLVTDGNVRENGNVSFVSKDKDLTEFVRDCITPSQPIHEERTSNAWRWYIWSIPLVKKLNGFGIFPRKSKTIRFPIFPEKVKWDFIRGILDGDGTIDKIGRISFSTGSYTFAVRLKVFFVNSGFNPNLYKSTRSFVVHLNVGDSINLARHIYQGNKFCLTRKKTRARNI
jgi:intein/homing endonuclease